MAEVIFKAAVVVRVTGKGLARSLCEFLRMGRVKTRIIDTRWPGYLLVAISPDRAQEVQDWLAGQGAKIDHPKEGTTRAILRAERGKE